MANPPSPPLDLEMDYYDFLSILPTATDSEIHRAYRRTNLKYHPDKFKPTATCSAEQAATLLDFLQKIYAVLRDPAERRKYDQGREANRRRREEAEKLETMRRKMKEELEKVESQSISMVNGRGVKRSWTEREIKVQNLAAGNRARMEEMMAKRREKQAREQEAAETETKANTEEPNPASQRASDGGETNEAHRFVKVSWVKEGDGLDIDEIGLRDRFEEYGKVEIVKLRPDKRRRRPGRRDKSVFGNGLVLFATVMAAERAVARGPRDGLETVDWATKRGEDQDLATEHKSKAGETQTGTDSHYKP